MSEPARTLPPQDSGSRTAPGPLRDWLATMKSHTPAVSRGDDRPAARPEPRPEPAPVDPKAARAADTAWSPRLVAAAEAPRAGADDADVSELMAENLMLKARLRLEAERQDELQVILADEIRALRQHIQDEIGSIEDLRAEQDAIRAEREEFRSERERFRQEREHMRAERDRAVTERDAARAERHALASAHDSLQEERDLWRARTEALAQPLFQTQKR